MHIERRNDSFKITVYCGKDEKNRSIRKSITYKPEWRTNTGRLKSEAAVLKEVDEYARDFEQRIKNGEYYEGEAMSFREFAHDHWLPEWADTHLTEAVKESYCQMLQNHYYPMLGNRKISDIKAVEIQAMVTRMMRRGYAPKTVKRYVSVLNSVMRYAFRMYVIKENPIDRCELPKEHYDTDLHYWTPDQAKTFLYKALPMEYVDTYRAHTRMDDTGICYSVSDYTETHKIEKQWIAYFTLAIYGGFRRGEMIALTWKDVDFKNRTISVNKAASRVKGGVIIKDPKTKASKRTVVMPQFCMDTLKKWKQIQKRLSMALGPVWQGPRGAKYDENCIFIQMDSGKMMDLSSPTNRFRTAVARYNKTVKNEEDKLPEIRLHDLRHTCATILIAEGVDIETISHRLGHSRASVTLDVYGHFMEHLDDTAADALAKILDPEGKVAW